jgi:hypothetical protein
MAGDVARGYDRADFEDAWARYLSPSPPGTSATSVTALQDPDCCTICGLPMNSAVVAAGETTHPTCG